VFLFVHLFEHVQVLLHSAFFVAGIVCLGVDGGPQDWLSVLGFIVVELVVDVDALQFHHVVPVLTVVLLRVDWVCGLEPRLVVFFVVRPVSEHLEYLSFVDFVLSPRLGFSFAVVV